MDDAWGDGGDVVGDLWGVLWDGDGEEEVEERLDDGEVLSAPPLCSKEPPE